MKKILIFIMIVFASNLVCAEPLEIKGLEIKYNYEKDFITYTLPCDAIMRQYVRLKDGPIVFLGEWEFKKAGEQRDKLIKFQKGRIDAKNLIYDLKAYQVIGDSGGFKNPPNIGDILENIGMETDLKVKLSVKKPRLGQFVHKYQKNIKQVLIDVEGEKKGLYTLKVSLSGTFVRVNKNIELPYTLESDFSGYPKGRYILYVEVKGDDKAMGIGGINVDII